MTNTKFRKRALLSSVAMLLVALVALGSATFAWYQANMTVTSAGMSFTTDAASGLQIIAANQVTANATQVNTSALSGATYGESATYMSNHTTLDPLSLNQTDGKFYTATGTNAADGTVKVGATIGDAGTSYVEEFVYFKIADAGTTQSGKVNLTGVQITAPTADGAPKTMSSAIRVVVYKFDGSIAGEYAISGGDKPYFIATGAYTAPEDDSDKVTIGGVAYDDDFVASKTVTTAANSGINVELGAVSKLKRAAFGCKVRVYLDGFDTNTISNNATVVGQIDTSSDATAADILKGISLSFTLTAPSTTVIADPEAPAEP